MVKCASTRFFTRFNLFFFQKRNVRNHTGTFWAIRSRSTMSRPDWWHQPAATWSSTRPLKNYRRCVLPGRFNAWLCHVLVIVGISTTLLKKHIFCYCSYDDNVIFRWLDPQYSMVESHDFWINSWVIHFPGFLFLVFWNVFPSSCVKHRLKWLGFSLFVEHRRYWDVIWLGCFRTVMNPDVSWLHCEPNRIGENGVLGLITHDGSMVLVYMLTFGVYWWDPCYHI